MDDDELYRLNALHRFSKHSRLVLEAHSHCEVPAGCGGAVLQWFNPADGAAVHFNVHAGRMAQEVFVDGERVRSSRTRLKPGPHLLALVLVPWANLLIARQLSWLMVNVTRRVSAVGIDQRIDAACSAADGSWRAATVEQRLWSTPEFDDATWSVLRPSRVRANDVANPQRQTFNQLSALGVQALALPEGETVFVRKRFVLPELPERPR